MTEMVRVAVAGDVTEAEEIQEILRSAGIEAELGDGEDDSVTISVPVIRAMCECSAYVGSNSAARRPAPP